MLKKIIFCAAFMAFFPVLSFAHLQRFYVPGLAPTQNVTSLELTPATTVIDESESLSADTLTAKAYYAFSPNYNMGIELPFSRWQSAQDSIKGLGDISLSAQAVQTGNKIDFGFKMETILPTATDDVLGTGKWQISPSFFAVYPVNKSFFAALGYKHYYSLTGEHNRDDINYGRIRLLLTYMDPDLWWLTIDPQYYIDYKNTGKAELFLETELGVMVNQGTSLYIKPGFHLGGNWQSKDWSLNIGFKILYL
ncbi:MAG: transporter [Elusimicrobiaceae bacterium]|nr:transporter [Elusimicrobiaceae bacterium]